LDIRCLVTHPDRSTQTGLDFARQEDVMSAIRRLHCDKRNASEGRDDCAEGSENVPRTALATERPGHGAGLRNEEGRNRHWRRWFVAVLVALGFTVWGWNGAMVGLAGALVLARLLLRPHEGHRSEVGP
jgi:hypothetical protein